MATAIEEYKAKTARLTELIKAGEARSLSEEESKEMSDIQTRMDVLEKDIDAFKAAEERAEAARKRQEELEKRQTPPPTPMDLVPADMSVQGKYSKQEMRDFANFDLARAIQLRALDRKIDGVEGEILARGAQEAIDSGVACTGLYIPKNSLPFAFRRADPRGAGRYLTRGNDITATGQTTTAGDQGGTLIQTDVLQPAPISWNPSCFERLGVTYVSGLKNDTKLPRSTYNNKTAPKPTHKTETAIADQFSYLFGAGKTLTPHRLPVYTSVAKQAIMQISYINQFVINELRGNLGSSLEYYAINGGDNAPTGLMSMMDVLTATTIDETNHLLAYKDYAKAVRKLKGYNIGIADNTSIGFLSTVAVEEYNKTTPKVAPVTSGAAIPVFLDEDGKVYNYPIEYSNNMPGVDNGGTVEGFLAGNFRDVVLATFGDGMEVVVDNLSRSKEGLIDVTFAIYWDIALKRENCLYKITDAVVAD
jgi:hypothetical protein